MRTHRRHPLFDGLVIGATTVASFGLFYLVLAQTDGLGTSSLNVPGAVCGNAICDVPLGETPASCPADCSEPLAPRLEPPPPILICGNAICDVPLGETPASCPADCSTTPASETPPPQESACGNRVCEAIHGESTVSCPVDCSTTPAPPPQGTVCGNSFCDAASGETSASCPQDCPAAPATDTTRSTGGSTPVSSVCGNDICEFGESAVSCPHDCSAVAPAIQLPLPCVERGITDPALCRALMDKLQANTNTNTNAPAPTTAPVCGNRVCEVLKGETPEKCATDCPVVAGTVSPTQPAIQLPKECVEKGIKDPDACKRLMEELRASGVPALSETHPPELCRLKGVTDPAECKTLMIGVFRSASVPAHEENGPPAATGDNDGKFDFSAMLPKACIEAKITEPQGCKELIRSQAPGAAEKPLPQECQAKGLKTLDECHKFFEERAILPECKKLGAKTLDECRSLLAAQHLPEECRDRGIADEKECRALQQKSFMPKTCDAQGAKTLDECKPMLLDKYGRPDECAGHDDAACWRLIEAGKVGKNYRQKLENDSKVELPEKCFEAGASNYEECERKFEERNVPAECREAGIFTRHGCEKHLFERSSAQIASRLPEECVEAGATELGACKKLMESRYFPSECAEANIADLDECKRFLVLKHMPKECVEAGIETKDDCEKLLRNRLMTPACEAQGITTKEACEEFIYGHVSGGVSCQGLGPEECAIAMKGRHLGAILRANEQLADIEEKIGDAANEDGTIDLAALAIRGDDVHARMTGILPIRPRRERRLRALRSSGQIAVKGDDTVDAAAGTLIAYDTDGDGLPDDVEARHDLDPEKPDTDGDGESDADELRKRKPKGFDKALVDDEAIGQPLVEGEIDQGLTVMLAPGGADDGDTATELSGTGIPGEVITLYIYSELPVVVTTTVDENGQWSYEMGDGLQEGSHEVYVAINDDTGKVVKKSDPLSLLIRGASAATAAQAAAEGTEDAAAAEPVALDAQANATEGTQVETDVRAFIFLGAALVLAGILIVVALVMRKRKKDKDRQDGNMLT